MTRHPGSRGKTSNCKRHGIVSAALFHLALDDCPFLEPLPKQNLIDTRSIESQPGGSVLMVTFPHGSGVPLLSKTFSLCQRRNSGAGRSMDATGNTANGLP